LLSEDSYLLEGLQSADNTKTHAKAKLQNAPTFSRNGSHSHVCLLLVFKHSPNWIKTRIHHVAKTCTYQLCRLQSTDTNILIGRYRLSADYRCISSGNNSCWNVCVCLCML